jgi:disulfide bond formation protein DsbB
MTETTLLRRARLGLAAVAGIAVLAMAFALYLQYEVGLKPCPLCSIQRLALIAAGLVGAIGALVARSPGALLAAGGLSGVFALAGAGVAGWHSWLLAFPPESMSCGRPFQWFHEDFPLVTWLPKLFRGDGDCLAVDWSLLGLTVPHWSLVVFVIALALLAVSLRASGKARAA